MKVNRDEIIRVEKYQKLKKELKLLQKDYKNVVLNGAVIRDSWSHKDFNFNYDKLLAKYIKIKIGEIKRKIKEMEE